MDNEQLRKYSKAMRRDCIIMADAAGDCGLHFGGSLSLIEIIAALYLDVMNLGQNQFVSEDRDRLILSKGHGVPAVYAALHQRGIVSDEELSTFKADVTELYGHPCMNQRLGIEFSTGSLGQGLSLGVGVALSLKKRGNIKPRVYVILGDGECDEGSVWEAAMSASKFGLNNIRVIVDQNKIQYDGNTEDIMPLQSLEEKWESFGWNVAKIDGHDIEQCKNAFLRETVKPLIILANTIKGKGISFMEGDPLWHHAKMSKEQRRQAWEELQDD